MGGDIDLALTRSYNSAAANVDGPFGFGWTNTFLLDYNVAFDPATSSRVVDPTVVDAYPVSLDLTWSPRGVVTLITSSGSRRFRHKCNTLQRRRPDISPCPDGS
jgi:hypothetical protein